jgi:dTMP kinase
MSQSNGLFIVLEGSDGSGKTTQFNLLKERLKAIGYEVEVFDFPRYDKESSYFVRQYLNGHYGHASEISPYTASLFFALDRYEAAIDIRKAVAAGKIVLSNRYVGSNMAHQGGKFSNEAEQRGFFVWEDNLEYQLLGIPRPDINFFLRVPAEVSYDLIKQKQTRSYTNKTHDEHEGDINHLRKSVATYDLLCRLFPKDFKAVDCTEGNRLLSITEINNLIWDDLKLLLPEDKPNPSKSVTVSLHAAEDKEVPSNSSQADKLRFPFKKSSLLLKLQIERQKPGSTGSFAAWHDAQYAFYTPSGLSRDLLSNYKAIVESLAKLHGSVRSRLKNARSGANIDEVLLPLTPLCALLPFELVIPKDDIESLCNNLLLQSTTEAHWAAKQIYLAAAQTWPNDFKRSLALAGDPEPLQNLLNKLVESHLSSLGSASESARLLEVNPRREFDILATSIYSYSNLSMDEIKQEVAEWPYSQKMEAIKQAVKVPELLDKVQYTLDVVLDNGTWAKLSSFTQLQDVQVQALTPRYGFDVPAAIEAAGLDDLYNECFDVSLRLYSLLQSASKDRQAPYATLMGHRARWQFKASARAIKQILDGKLGLDQSLLDDIYEKVSESHPLLWESLNRPSRPALKANAAHRLSKKAAKSSASRQNSRKPKK